MSETQEQRQPTPLTDARLAEVERRQAGRWSLGLAPAVQRHWQMVQMCDDAGALLDEVHRLRAECHRQRLMLQEWHAQEAVLPLIEAVDDAGRE